jgi:hypothetical protein
VMKMLPPEKEVPYHQLPVKKLGVCHYWNKM